MSEVYIKRTLSNLNNLAKAVRKGGGKYTVDNVLLVHKETEMGTWRGVK